MQLGQLMVFTNAVPGREAEFSKWYSDVHVPDVCRAAPEIKSAQRFELNPIALLEGQSGWGYLTVYEIAAENLQTVLERMNAAMINGEIEMTDSADLTSITMYYANPL